MTNDTRLSFQTTTSGYPILKSPSGQTITLTQSDIDSITDLVSNGHSPDFVAHKLGVSVKEFDRARANNELVANAIRVGLANDDADVTKVIRDKALDGNMLAAIHYTKHKLGWQSAESKNAIEKSKPTVLIQINTGIDRGNDTTVETSIIEGSADEDLF